MPVVRHAQTRADITMVAQWTYSAKPPNLFRPLYWPLHPEAQGISCRASVFLASRNSADSKTKTHAPRHPHKGEVARRTSIRRFTSG